MQRLERRRASKEIIFGDAADHMEAVDPVYESDGFGEVARDSDREDYECRSFFEKEFLMNFGSVDDGNFEPYEDPEARGVSLDEYRKFVKKEARKSKYLRSKTEYLDKLARGEQKVVIDEDVEEAEILETEMRKLRGDEAKKRVSEDPLEIDAANLARSALGRTYHIIECSNLLLTLLACDPELRNLLRETGFKGLIGKPTFQEALLEAERVLSNIPVSLRSKLNTKESEYSSQLYPAETKDMFWGNLSKVIMPSIPSKQSVL